MIANRPHILRGVLVLFVAAAVWAVGREGGPLERHLEQRAMDHLLTDWGLPVTPVTRRMAAGAFADVRREANGRIPARRPPAFRPAPDGRFSARWTHDELRDDGLIRIACFAQEPEIRDRLAAVAAAPRWSDPRIRVEVGRTVEDFRRAVAEADLVLFAGHANLGRGIELGQGDEAGFIPMAPPRLSIPVRHLKPDDVILEPATNGRVVVRGSSAGLDALDFRCKGFWYLGCRTEAYYRDALRERAPRMDLVTTRYVIPVDAGDGVRTIVLTLIHGLQARAALADIVAELNRHRAFDELVGLREEIHAYGNGEPMPPGRAMFTCE